MVPCAQATLGILAHLLEHSLMFAFESVVVYMGLEPSATQGGSRPEGKSRNRVCLQRHELAGLRGSQPFHLGVPEHLLPPFGQRAERYCRQ